VRAYVRYAIGLVEDTINRIDTAAPSVIRDKVQNVFVLFCLVCVLLNGSLFFSFISANVLCQGGL
jgi:hypothetical protein